MFATFNNKELGNFKVYLKECMIINRMSFPVKMLWSRLHRTSISEKVTVLKNYTLLRKVQLLKKKAARRSTCFGKVHVLNNYLFWRSCSPEAVTVLQNYLCSRSSWSEKAFVTKKWLLERSRQLAVQKVFLCKKVPASKKRLLPF